MVNLLLLLTIFSEICVFYKRVDCRVKIDLDNAQELFSQWTKKYHKVYHCLQDRIYRYGVFYGNLKIYNDYQSKNYTSYKVQLGPYADLTTDEFHKTIWPLFKDAHGYYKQNLHFGKHEEDGKGGEDYNNENK